MKVEYRYGLFWALITILLMEVFVLGVSLNWMAISNNGCKMPVLANEIYDDGKHFIYADKNEVKYWYLTDVIRGRKYIESVGDLLMSVSKCLIIFVVFMAIFSRWRMFKSGRKHGKQRVKESFRENW